MKNNFTQIALGDFTAMCMREFASIRETMATKDDLAELESRLATKSELRQEIYELETRLNEKFEKIDKRFDGIEKHIGRTGISLDNIAEIVLEDHRSRIHALEKKALLK